MRRVDLSGPVPWRMTGRSAVVVGAGSGIGTAIATILAEAGARVHCVDIDAGAAQEIAARLAARGLDASSAAADATDEGQLRDVIDAFATGNGGGIEALVSTVGAVSRVGAEDCSLEEWEMVQAVNVRSAFLAAKVALPHLTHHGGSVVLISSKVALHGVRNTVAYSAAKGAVSALVRQLSADYAWDGVRFNALAPSAVEDTGMFASRADPAAARKRFIENVPLSHAHGQLIQSRDIAMAALFLLSDMGRMITGQTIVIDAGQGGWDGTPPRQRAGAASAEATAR